MSFNRPTLSELISRVQTDIKSKLTTAEAALRHAMLKVLGAVLAAVAHGLYGNLAWLAKQLFPDTAESEYLARYAAARGVSKKGATAATAKAAATGTDDQGIGVDTEVQRVDGTRFKVTEYATISGGTATLSLEAIDAGSNASLSVGEQLTISTAISGVNATVTVTSAIAGTDEETDESLLARLLERLRKTPAGGKLSDYEAWAKEVPGVTRAWAYRNWMGAGTVGLTFVMDGRDDIIPTADDVVAVQAAVDVKCPATATLYVFAPTPVEVPIQLTISPDNEEVRAAIVTELDDLFAREAEPEGTIYLSRLNAAVSAAQGEEDHTTMAPASNFVSGAGQFPVRGDVVFV